MLTSNKTSGDMPSSKVLNAPFQHLVIVTDRGDAVASAQIQMRFEGVKAWAENERVKRHRMPADVKLTQLKAKTAALNAIRVDDIPFENVDSSAFALYNCFRGLGRQWPSVFVHTCNHSRTPSSKPRMLITDYGNVFVGPDNGNLGLLQVYFADREIDSTLWELDANQIESLEQHRMEEPSYHIPKTFYGRDVYAVAAGLAVAGIAPEQFATQVKQPVQALALAEGIANLPERMGEKIEFMAFRDNTIGNLKTNLTADTLTFNQLMEEGAQYRIANPNGGLFTAKPLFTVSNQFAAQPEGQPMLYLSSTFAPEWDQRFMNLALNRGNASLKLGLPRSYSGAAALTLQRVR